MSLVDCFSIRNRQGKEIGLSFSAGKKTKGSLIALLLKEDKDGLVVWVESMSFVRLDRKWLPMVCADRSYLERPKDFMGVLEEGKLRFSCGWKESKWKTLWWLLKWRWNRRVGLFEQPMMDKAFSGGYKKYDPLGLG